MTPAGRRVENSRVFDVGKKIVRPAGFPERDWPMACCCFDIYRFSEDEGDFSW